MLRRATAPTCTSSRLRRRFPGARDVRGEEGFTLIEIMATALIVAIAASAMAMGLIGSAHLSGMERSHAQATTLAARDQERLRGMDGKELNGLNQTQTISLDGNNYTVNSSAVLTNTTGNPSCASSGGGAVAYYSVTSTVSWTAVNGQNPSVSEHSLIAPPPGGTLQATVDDQTGNTGLAGVNVSAAGPTPATTTVDSGTTDNGGCIQLTGLATGGYTVTMSKTGYVDPNGNSTITNSTNVTSTGTAYPSTNPNHLGLAGALGVVFQSQIASGTLTSQLANDVSWYGAGSAVSMTAPQTSAVASPYTGTTVASLFPFAYTSPSLNYTNNYTVWSGSCPQEQPPNGTDQFSVWPGSNQTSQVVSEPALGILATYNGATVVPHVRLTFQSITGTTCSKTWYPATASSSSPTTGVLKYPGQPFAAGTSASPASPAGTASYQVCVDYNNHYTTVSNVNNNNMSAINWASASPIAITSSSPTGTC